jgi:hypothetical protein
MKIFFLLTVCFLSFNAFSQNNKKELHFLVDGKKQKTLDLSTIQQLKASTVEYYDHVYRKAERFKGIPFIALLTYALPDALKNVVELEFISINGYKTYIPIENFYKVESILSYEAVNAKFERYSQKEKEIISLGPYYLVWDFKTIGTEDKFQYSSVYQIDQINLITNAVDFSVHEVKDNEAVAMGFRTYKKYCLSCHAIENWGGNIGIDLVNKKILEKKGSDYIIQYALEPKVINQATKMRPLPKYNNRLAMAKGVSEFLNFAANPDRYITNKKIKSDIIRYDAFKKIINEMKIK